MTFLWLRTWQLGVKSLLLHPLRSALTVLGIFIGVASVIWLLAIGEGISNQAQKQIAELGANNIIIRSVKPPSESTNNSRIAYGITRDDYDRLISTIPTIERALPIREIRRKFKFEDNEVDGRLVGCTPEYAKVTVLTVDRGHFITDAEVKNRDNVCVLAAGTSDTLFPYQDPLDDKTIHVDDAYYTVVGVMKARASSAGIGGSLAAQDFSKDVYIPISTLWARIGDAVRTRRVGSFEAEVVELTQVTLRVRNVDDVMKTSALVENTLKQTHRTPDYSVTVPLELLEQAKTTRMMFIVLLGFIAAISLVVGGIGIMNIMLATVTERTREIGIRRALGAKQSDITRQFLAETVALSVVGGLTGIIGGLTCPLLSAWLLAGMQYFFPSAMQSLPEVVRHVTPAIVPMSIPLAFGISVAVGVIFGLYPAVRAARMDPIEALRHE